jgi:hypothetical protein
LSLQVADTLHQFFQRFGRRWSRTGNRPLWGWADIQREHMLIPWSGEPSSRDPDQPGVFVSPSGVMELGVWRGMDGSNVYLEITSVSPNGFAGTWSSKLSVIPLSNDGRALPDPKGHFCAVRRP